MTLIAGLSFENVPTLIGDLLVHSYHSSENHVDLPSVGSSQEIIEPGWGFSLALCQKIFLINQFTACAWSGSYIAARGLLSEFQTLAGNQRLSQARTQDFFRALRSDKEYADLSVICLTALSGRASHLTGYNIGSCPNEHFKSCIYAGSGGDAFQSTSSMLPPLLLEGPPAERAISITYGMIGAFLTREINSRSPFTDIEPNPLTAFYGGGWELASVGDGMVYKLGDTTSFFWHVDEFEDGKFMLTAPSLILKTHYIGAFLVRRWLRGNGSLRWSAPWSEQRCQVTRPIVGEGSTIDVSDPHTWPPFASTFQMHALLFTSFKRKRFVLTWTNWVPSRYVASTNVQFTESSADQCTIIEVQPQALRKIHSIIPSVSAQMREAEQL